MTDRSPVPTGSPPVDDLLGGGLSRGAITQVYGPPAAGKSTLAMSSAVAVARGGDTAVYIDTEGLSSDRLEQIAAAGVEAGAVGKTLDRVMVSTATDFDEQAARIREAGAVADGVDLIVLDSVTALYRVERAAEAEEGATLERLADQLAFLLGLARRYDLAVLITNQVFTDPDEDAIRPLGGTRLAHWSSTIIRLDRFRGGRRRLTLERHGAEPADGRLMLELTDDGLAGGGPDGATGR